MEPSHEFSSTPLLLTISQVATLLNLGKTKVYELIEKENGRVGVLPAAAFGAQLVADFSAGDKDAARVPHFAVGNQREETRFRKFLDIGAGVGMAQHAFGSKNDQRLTPSAAHLAAEHVEILRGGRRLTDLHVVFGGELHESLHARAGMLRSLTLVAVGQ